MSRIAVHLNDTESDFKENHQKSAYDSSIGAAVLESC